MSFRKKKTTTAPRDPNIGLTENGYYDYGIPERRIDLNNLCANCPVFANIPRDHFDNEPTTGSYVRMTQDPPRTQSEAAMLDVSSSFPLKEEHRYPDYNAGLGMNVASVSVFLTDVPKTATGMYDDANRTLRACEGPKEPLDGQTNVHNLAAGSLACGAGRVRMNAIQPEGWLNPRTVR